jgi:hypothetical protein
MATIYVVTSGSYSDYGINAMFSTRELAQEYIDKAIAAKDADGEEYNVSGVYWAGDAQIEEWSLDEQRDAAVTTKWRVGMLLDDGSVPEGPYEQKEFESVSKESVVEQYDANVPCYSNRPIVRVISYKSAEHALKLAAEQRQKWLREKVS